MLKVCCVANATMALVGIIENYFKGNIPATMAYFSAFMGWAMMTVETFKE